MLLRDRPWLNEPDYWVEEGPDRHLIAIRREAGHWVGYVGLPAHRAKAALPFVKGHGPLRLCRADKAGGLSSFVYVEFRCDCLGDETPDGVGDLVPRDGRHPDAHEVYRTLSYVQAQCRALADRLEAQSSWRARLRRWFGRPQEPQPCP